MTKGSQPHQQVPGSRHRHVFIPVIRLSLLGLLLFRTSLLFSQQQAVHWFFGENAGLQFELPFFRVKAIQGGALSTLEGCSSISDSTGRLLFYTDGIKVWNAKHQLMPNGAGLKSHFSSTQAALIVPKPGDGCTYYIFTADAGDHIAPPNEGIHFSEVNLCLENGLGDVVAGSKNTFLHRPSTEKLAAVLHDNGADVWVMTHDWQSNLFRAYLVTERGVQREPVVSAVGQLHTNTPDLSYRSQRKHNSIGQMKFSPQGDKLAVAVMYDGLVELFDFDGKTGKVYNPQLLVQRNGSSMYGLEFSPDGRKLYASLNDEIIGKFDLNAGSLTEIQASIVYFSALDLTEPGFLSSFQLGPDGKIYVAVDLPGDYHSITVNAIDQPNAPGLNSVYQKDKIRLADKTWGAAGLPGFVASYFDATPRIEARGTCAGAPVRFKLLNTDYTAKVTWHFGDSASGAANAAASFSCAHQYSGPGAFTASARVQMPDGRTFSLSKKVIVQAIPEFDLGRDTGLCAGQTLELRLPSLPGRVVRWQDGSNAPTFKVTKPGVYWAEACGMGCVWRDSIRVDYLTEPTVALGRDTLLCGNATIRLRASTLHGSYRWQDQSTDSTYLVREPGTYWVAVRTPCGSTADTIRVEYEAIPSVNLGRDTTLCIGQTLQLNGRHPLGKRYSWSNGASGPVQAISKPGTYWVKVRGTFCSFTDTIKVSFNECPSELFIPNVFTPDGDGINETFEVKGIALGKWQLLVYNRYGREVYRNAQYLNDWNGETLPAGVYYYHLQDKDRVYSYRGWVQILR